ncbi:MAG: BatD family protein [Fibrobacteraceae bacterium]|nr:BatD family protein [Fibrobacteraceae bacterium]
MLTNTYNKSILFFPLLLTALSAVSAFAFDISVKSSVTASQVLIGDRFNYEIDVTAPENATVELPSFVGNLGSFEVKDMKHEKIIEGLPKGRAKFVWRSTLNTFVAGEFLIAPQEVQAVIGKDTVNTRTDPVAVKVAARTTGDETDILDVEDPIKDPRLPVWLYWILGILAAAVLVLAGWFLHKKLRKQSEPVQLPPYEEAVLELKKLRDLQLLALGNQADFFTALSFIVRRYIQRRYLGEIAEVKEKGKKNAPQTKRASRGILDATLSQLKKRIPAIAELPDSYKAAVISLEEETYPVRFAKMKIGDDRGIFWDDFAAKFFDDTKPMPEMNDGTQKGSKKEPPAEAPHAEGGK